MSKLTEEEKIELRRRKLKEKRKQKKIEKKQRKREEKDEQKEPDNQKMPLSFDLGIVFDKLLQVGKVFNRLVVSGWKKVREMANNLPSVCSE